ncbi:MAG TPA: PA2779 family protein [Burkholderiaceae bacterium]|nr:PA2779 family protein [Burkholderiaceae bacterium]
MDSLPAGGDSVIGVIVFIFVLLLITDILGLTKVFPFTRAQR